MVDIGNHYFLLIQNTLYISFNRYFVIEFEPIFCQLLAQNTEK